MRIRVSALDMTQVACSSAFAPVRPAPRGSPPFRRRVASRAARRALAASASADDDAPEPSTPPDAETQKAPAPKARRASIGFVGGGAMAEAIARGFVAGGAARFSDLAVSHGSDPATAARWRALDVDVLSSNAEILDRCDVVFFAVKPHILPGVLNECGAHVDVDRHLFVSVAAGVSSSFIEDSLKKAASKGIAPGRPGPGAMPSSNKKEIAEKNTRVVTVSTPKVVRVMPNTPCLVGEAASAACKGSAASDEDVTFVVELMRSCGLCLNVSS
jgi:pyrroline-5-carboxylate reductase